MSQKIIVSIAGATGYTGLELIRLLVNHPNVRLKYLISTSHAGKKISDVWPHLKNICDLTLTTTDLTKVASESDVVFLALPHYESQKIVKDIVGTTKIIDLSADFRLKDLEAYKRCYHYEHEYAKGVGQFVYGFSEINKAKIAESRNISNPGCFAIASQLALLPLKTMIDSVSILAVTGSSGSGKNLKDETHHPLRAHNMVSYRIGTHQHIPEIIQSIGIPESAITFVPTSGPFIRGIHLTAFVNLNEDLGLAQILELFNKKYIDAPFVRLKNKVQLSEVIGSNFCDIAINFVNQKPVIQVVIDNLVKGASGNAIQNMNIMCGLDETCGLKTIVSLFP